MRHCLKIRNQYAHHHFYDDHSGKLALVNLEEHAKAQHHVPDFKSLSTFYVDVPLLKTQENYWHVTDRYLTWLNYKRRNINIARGEPTLPAKPPLHL